MEGLHLCGELSKMILQRTGCHMTRTGCHVTQRCYCAVSSGSATGGINKMIVSTASAAQTTFKHTMDGLWNTVSEIQLPKINITSRKPTPHPSINPTSDTPTPELLQNHDNEGGDKTRGAAVMHGGAVLAPRVDCHDLERMMEECNKGVTEYHTSQDHHMNTAPTPDEKQLAESVLAKFVRGEKGIQVWDRVRGAPDTPAGGRVTQPRTLPYTTAAVVDEKTRCLLQAVRRSSTNVTKIIRLEEFIRHVIDHPDTRVTAVKEKAIQLLLWFRKTQYQDKILLSNINKSLALLGHVDPVKGQGVRILSIDGGGVRGLVALETLMALSQRCYELTGENFLRSFDYIMGTSTGAIVNWMINFGNVPLQNCIPIYRELATKVFDGNRVLGAGRLVWKHAYYDTNAWISAIKQFHGADKQLIDMTDPKLPKIAALSALMNTPLPLSYVFRNYTHPVGTESRYPGDCRYKLWEALVASTAAPGYFEEVRLNGHIHQDGGVLTNNPSGVAIHEAKLLWPGVPVQCVVSLGTGGLRSVPEDLASGTTPLKSKVLRIVDSATDTEGIHSTLKDLLPDSTYYRFNPVLPDYINIDECDPDKLDRMQASARAYAAINAPKVDSMIKQLTLKKTHVQTTRDKLRDLASTFRK